MLPLRLFLIVLLCLKPFGAKAAGSRPCEEDFTALELSAAGSANPKLAPIDELLAKIQGRIDSFGVAETYDLRSPLARAGIRPEDVLTENAPFSVQLRQAYISAVKANKLDEFLKAYFDSSYGALSDVLADPSMKLWKSLSQEDRTLLALRLQDGLAKLIREDELGRQAYYLGLSAAEKARMEFLAKNIGGLTDLPAIEAFARDAGFPINSMPWANSPYNTLAYNMVERAGRAGKLEEVEAAFKKRAPGAFASYQEGLKDFTARWPIGPSFAPFSPAGFHGPESVLKELEEAIGGLGSISSEKLFRSMLKAGLKTENIDKSIPFQNQVQLALADAAKADKLKEFTDALSSDVVSWMHKVQSIPAWKEWLANEPAVRRKIGEALERQTFETMKARQAARQAFLSAMSEPQRSRLAKLVADMSDSFGNLSDLDTFVRLSSFRTNQFNWDRPLSQVVKDVVEMSAESGKLEELVAALRKARPFRTYE